MTSTAQIIHVVVDCADPQRLSAFWSAALGREVADDWGGFVRLAPDAAGTYLAFAVVPEPKSTKNRVHLDLTSDDRPATVAQLVALGASVIDAEREMDGHRWAVLADPEGNEFCIG